MMKKPTTRPKVWFLFLAFAASSLLLSACAIQPIQAALGMDSITTQEFEIDDFEEIEVSDAFDVQIRQGDEFYIKVEVDDTALPYLQVRQRGDTLEIGLRPRWGIFFWNFDSVLRAEITMPTLVGITARDSSHVEVNGFSTDEEAAFEATDASTIVGEIDTGNTEIFASDASNIELSGDRQDIEVEAGDASEITLRGEGANATIRATDSSHVDLSEFPLQDVKIRATDASTIRVDVRGTLDAEASDSSDVLYEGDPTLGDIVMHDGSSVEAN